MKTTEELQNLYENKLKPALQAIEGKRKSILKKYVLCIVGALAAFLTASAFSETYIIVFYLAIAVIIGLGLYIFFVVMKEQKAYRAIYKTDVVKQIVNLINPDWQYEPEGKISISNYYKSQLFSKQFAHADFNKEIKGRTFVLPEHASKQFSKFGMSINDGGKTELVKLENVEFEKIFKVYGTDQIESRYVLTPRMMEAMVNIYKQYKKRVYFSFIGSRVYVAMSFNKDLFEPRIIKSGVRFEDMEQMNSQFNLIQTLIHEMNLNTRIWTKD